MRMRLRACGFAECCGVVRDRTKRDAVLARGFEAARNRVSPGITNHESGKGLLQRIGGVVLLFESGKRDFLDFALPAKRTLESCNGVELGERLRPAHLKKGRWMRRICRYGQSKCHNIMKRNVAHFRLA